MPRYSPAVEDGTIVIETEADAVEVGDLAVALDLLGGPAWTITYTEREKRRYPDLDTADEGITLDVVDCIHAMTVDESFVETLRALPADPPAEGSVSPRFGFFLGRLLENLEHGVR